MASFGSVRYQQHIQIMYVRIKIINSNNDNNSDNDYNDNEDDDDDDNDDDNSVVQWCLMLFIYLMFTLCSPLSLKALGPKEILDSILKHMCVLIMLSMQIFLFFDFSWVFLFFCLLLLLLLLLLFSIITQDVWEGENNNGIYLIRCKQRPEIPLSITILRMHIWGWICILN